MQLVLFNPKIGPCQVLPFWARLDQGAMVMKGCSTFPKPPALLEPHHHRSLWVLFSRTDGGFCIFHLLVWWNLNFLHISQWITLPTQSNLVLYFLCANFLHSFIMWLMILYLSPHSLPLQFCCVLSILALIWLVLTTLFCAAFRRDYVSLLMFPFLSHVHVLSCEMLLLLFSLLLLLLVFHISLSWWFFTGVWVTASLLKSPGLFLVFLPFSII